MREVRTEVRSMREMQEAHDKKAQRALAVMLEESGEFADIQRRVPDAEAVGPPQLDRSAAPSE